MPRILDVEQAMLLLELEAPFDQRGVQLARRRMAKRWHPDIAPPGRQHEHQRHLQAINEAADQLEQLAESVRGGRVTRNAVKVSAAATRKAREEAGRRAYEEEQRARATAEDRAKHDPFGSRVPDHSVVHRYARCVAYPEWGVGTVTGIYFSGDDEDTQQWARVMFSIGVRTVPAGSLQFVDFSTPDPAADRVQRFMTAAQHALAEGDAALAAQRLVYARDAEPSNPVGAEAADDRASGRRATCPRRPAPSATGPGSRPIGRPRSGSRPGSTRTWARSTWPPRPLPEPPSGRPADASAWERLGRLRLRLMDRPGAISALEQAKRGRAPRVEGLLDLALAYHLAGDVGAEVSAADAASGCRPGVSGERWTTYAHALARTDRISECIDACRRRSRSATNPEVADLTGAGRRRRSRASSRPRSAA